MATMTRRRRVIAAIVALAVIVAIVAIGLVGTGHSTPGAAAPTVPIPAVTTPVTPTPVTPTPVTPTTVAAPPAAADVAAARACEAFAVYLEDAQAGEVPAAAGRALIEDAAVLLRGATKDETAHRALPRWSALGSELLASAEDVVDRNTEALDTDGAEAGAQCRTVPAAAAAAGGFTRSA